MARFDIPSAVVVAVDGGDSYIKPYGEKRIGEGAPIGPDSVFNIASCSKAFCAALAASLVDDGVVEWDDRIAETIDDFALSDPWVSEHVTLRDFLGMRSGLKREGIVEYGFNPRGKCTDYLETLPHVGWETGFRERFTYSNTGYAMAAILLERAAGEPYRELLRKRIFAPAGMKTAVSKNGLLNEHPDHFYPHVRVVALDEPVSVGWEGSTAVYLSGNDAIQWLRLQLGDGELNGQRILSQQSVNETRTPHAIDIPGKLTGEHFSLYAMGWQAFDYHGRAVYRHTGSELGSSTFTLFCPEARIGVACYVSIYSAAAVAAGYSVFDALLGVSTRDWAQSYEQIQNDRIKESVADVKKRFVEHKEGALHNDLESYVGRYESPIYRSMRIFEEGGALRIEFDDQSLLTASLIPVGQDVFDIKHDNVVMEQELFGEYMRLKGLRASDRVQSIEHWLFGVFDRKEA